MFDLDASAIRDLMMEREINGVLALSQAAQINAATAKKSIEGGRVNFKSCAALAKFFGVNFNEILLKKEKGGD